MPRSRIRAGKLAAQTMSNSLIASARNLTMRTGNDYKPRKIKPGEWESIAWHLYRNIEVYHYAVQWVGNTLSRATIFAAENGKITTNAVALDAMNKFFGGPDQHGEFLRQSAIHMTVAGEGYIIQETHNSEDWWTVAAATKVKNRPDGGIRYCGEDIDDSASLVMRFWRPDPEDPQVSDSPTRPLIPILAQLERLTKYVDAQLDSRLTGNGLMLFPNDMTFPDPTTSTDGTAQQGGVDAFMAEWAKTMGAALENPGSSAARLPTGMSGPADSLEKMRHLTLWTELDEHAPALRVEAVTRIALGLDIPADALLGGAGGGDMNHWSAWQIDDSLIKSHAEPLLALITEALTTDYLRVILEEDGMAYEDTLAFTVEADTIEMRLRPNRSKEAFELWDRGEIGGTALRREAGFAETDAMENDEKKEWLLLKVAQGSPDPRFVAFAAKQLGIEIPDELVLYDEVRQTDSVKEDPAGNPTDTPPTRGDRPLPRSLKDHPTQDPPVRPSAVADMLLFAAEPALFRALERAGNRLKSTGAKIEGIPSDVKAMDRYQFVTLSREQLNEVLTDAWSNLDRLTLPDGVGLEQFEAALDNYARMMISSRGAYDREVLRKYLTLALARDAA